MKSIFPILTLVLTVYTLGANAQVKKPVASPVKKPVAAPVKKPATTTPAPAPAGLYNITELSFFNPAHIALLEKQVADEVLKIKNVSIYNDSFTGKIFSRANMNDRYSANTQQFLSSEFRPLGNKWFYVVNLDGGSDELRYTKGTLVRRENDYTATGLIDKGNNYPIIALNDSIYVLNDGTLFNIFLEDEGFQEYSESKELQYSENVPRKLKVITKNTPASQPLLAHGDILIGKESYSSYSFNILSNKLSDYTTDRFSFVAPADNRFSNYLLGRNNVKMNGDNLCLINRYNVEDTIHVKDFNTELISNTFSLPKTYNDSLLVITFSLQPFNDNFSNENATELLLASSLSFNSNFSKESIDFPMQNLAKHLKEKVDWLQAIKKPYENSPESDQQISSRTSWFGNYPKSLYFEKVFNLKKEEKVFSAKVAEQQTKIAQQFIQYDPEFLVVLNYRTNKLVSVLSRNGLPFQGIRKLLIDKSNTLLIAQASDNVFSIFDLRNGKEIFSAKGIINHISDDNKLMLNFSMTSKVVYQEQEPNYIDKLTGYSLSLTDLIQKNNVYYSSFTESLNVDEFTTPADFNTKMDALEKKNRSLFFAQEKLTSNQPLVFAKPYQPTNKTIKNAIESQLVNFITNQGPIPADIRIDLGYSQWDPTTQLLTLKSKKSFNADTIAYFSPQVGAKWNWEQNIPYDGVYLLDSFRIFKRFRGFMENDGSVIFEIGPVEAEKAKGLKDGTIKLSFILHNEGVNIPDYNYIFANRFYKTIYERKGGYDKLNFDGKLDKYFEKTYQLKRTQFNFYDQFFMEENGELIPLKPKKINTWIRLGEYSAVREGDPYHHSDGYPEYDFFQLD
ncbi:MAG: hypothetical protein RLZ47_252 [Bacteroidota bacterium]|jgi:hypothetical protein